MFFFLAVTVCSFCSFCVFFGVLSVAFYDFGGQYCQCRELHEKSHIRNEALCVLVVAFYQTRYKVPQSSLKRSLSEVVVRTL